ncbi:MAG: NirD/YgiW/YdeI family stress tolerance protein, partial [Alphaproteobacteria bacterium]|nr:NirD/YgiW/YdeI family stress tolerance protein [Alphaproteobacteria bacterium]
EVMVEIDSDVWNGQNVSPTDTVTIIGEIDQEGNATVVEVDELMLAPQASLQQ